MSSTVKNHIMRPILLFLTLILFAGCSTVNQVVETNDNFRENRTISIKQQVIAPSDVPGIWDRYWIDINWSGIRHDSRDKALYLNFIIETSIQQEHLNPEIYLMSGQRKFSLLPIDYRSENFDVSSSSTSVSTTNSKETIKKENKETVSESTQASANTSTVTEARRFVRYKYLIDDEFAREIVRNNDFVIRFYLGDEGYTTKYRRRDIAALTGYLKRYLLF